jgi:putative aldouronate transport system permease protein
MKNTLYIAIIKNFLLWPLPIIFALIVHNCRGKGLRKFTQTVSYLPHLVSTVVVVCIIDIFCNYETGLLNVIIQMFGGNAINFSAEGKYFLPMYFISDIWVSLGAEAVIFIAALSSVDVQLIEAAEIDGANKIQRIWHVDIPAIAPTIILVLIMNMGRFLNFGYEKALLMQNDLNLGATEIIGTYVYKTGMQSMQYSFSAAVSLFNNVIGLILVIVANTMAKKYTDSSLF